MPEITVEHPDGSTETIPGTVAPSDGNSYTRTRQIGSMRRATINVYREDARSVTLNEKRDLIHLGDVDTLRLVDIQTGGPTWQITAYSLEWDANREPYTAGGDLREGNDQELITDLIGEVDSWTAGDIGNFAGPMSFVFNHAHQHEALRRIEKNVSGELRFRDAGTVDYVDRLGSDKSASVELSASAGTIEDEISITKRGRELDGTHVRVLGAHEGEAQIFANLVPEDDPDTYENEVRYSTPRWSGPEDTDWDRWANKDVTDQATIEEEAASLGAELKESLVEATVTTNLGDLSVGDTVQVVKPDANLNRSMRIHRIKEVVKGAVETAKLTLSTRTTMRNDETEDLRDIQRFNTGFQGSSVVMNIGPLEKAIDATNDVTVPFRYPDIEFENVAQLHIRGLPYRIDSQGAAAGGTDDDTTSGGGDHTHEVDLNDLTNRNTTYQKVGERQQSFAAESIDYGSWSVVDTFTPSSITSEVHSLSRWRYVGGEDTETIQLNLRVTQPFSQNYWPTEMGLTTVFIPGGSDGSQMPSIPIPGNFQSDDLVLEAQVASGPGSGSEDFSVSAVWNSWDTHEHLLDVQKTSDASGGHTHSFSWRHTHNPDPGIYTTGDTPSNVDVAVNGSTVATDIGSGTFETVIDVSDEFNVDQWNDITVSSDSLGIVSVAGFIEGYDQIGKR